MAGLVPTNTDAAGERDLATEPVAGDRPRVGAPRGPGLPPLVAVVLASWFVISSSLLPYPLGVDGQDAQLRDSGLSLVLLFSAVSWYRARTHRRRFLLAFAVFAALVVVESLVDGGPGALGAAAWNERVAGILMLVTAAAGWRGSGHDRVDVG
jgi:hypothetical protein